ncbi:MAG TPA: DivIVA domain-containing protein [Mycobacteriales bacterium]|nr:DivIVA domain-containing protein [Mycobacteriales bacterium]
MVVAIVVVIGAILVAGLALWLVYNGGGLEPESVDHADLGLPDDGPLDADDVPRLRFRIGWRGYRMEDVDAALDRIAESMRAQAGDADREPPE